MGAYREQRLRDTGGSSTKALHRQTRGDAMPSGFLTTFKIRFTISLCLFGFFAWMSLTGKEIYHISADQIEAAVESDILQGQISDGLIKLGIFE